LRYKYAGNATADSREFCVNMVGLSQSGMVWRREDIDAMSAAGENNGFAPAGSSSYDIFKYKGGVNCKHHWQRVIYMRKRDQGRFLPNDGLNNDKVVRNVDFLKPKGEEAINNFIKQIKKEVSRASKAMKFIEDLKKQPDLFNQTSL